MKELNYCWRCGSELVRRQDEGRRRYYCNTCEEFVYRNSVPVAGVFVIKRDKILLIKRGGEPNKGKWSYPAGYLEYDERPETGAVRELKEETNLDVEESKLELITTIQLEHPDKYVVGNAYAVSSENVKGDLNASDDALDARFWSIKEMKDNSGKLESKKIIEAAQKAISIIEDD